MKVDDLFLKLTTPTTFRSGRPLSVTVVHFKVVHFAFLGSSTFTPNLKQLNSYAYVWEQYVEIINKLHVKLSPFGFINPNISAAVIQKNISATVKHVYHADLD